MVLRTGFGSLDTFWLVQNKSRSQTGSIASNLDTETTEDHESDLAHIGSFQHSTGKIQRLVEWNVEILSSLLKQLLSYYNRTELTQDQEFSASQSKWPRLLDHVVDVIEFPRYEDMMNTSRDVDLDDKVTEQLTSFVSMIAGLYHDNPYVH